MKINGGRPRASFARFVARALLLAALLLSVVPVAGAAPTGQTSVEQANPPYELRMAQTGAPVVDGQTVLSGKATLAVSPDRNIVGTRVYVDPAPELLETGFAGAQAAVADGAAPFGNVTLDTTALADGVHTVVVVVDLADGRTMMNVSRVQVHNGGPALFFEATPLEA